MDIGERFSTVVVLHERDVNRNITRTGVIVGGPNAAGMYRVAYDTDELTRMGWLGADMMDAQ